MHGLVTDSNGANVPLEFPRIAAPVDLVHLWDIYHGRKPDASHVPRPSFILPEPGIVHVHLALGEKRGSGRSSIVHNVEIFLTKPLPGHLPPLVLKVGRSKRRDETAREAWFYNEMECLQGVILTMLRMV